MNSTRALSFFGLVLFLTAILTLFASQNTLSVNTYYTYIYAFFLFLFLLFGFFFAQVIGGKEFRVPANLYTYLFTFLGVVFLVTLITFVTFYSFVITVHRFMQLLLLFLILVHGLAIFHQLFVGRETIGFLSELVFFIPCMVEEAWTYIARDILGTSRVTLLLILFEILLIAFFFLLPVVLTTTRAGRINILPGVVFLDHPTILSNSELFHVKAPPQGSYFTSLASWLGPPLPDTEIVFNQSYSLSFWVYLNPVSLTREVNIFNYGAGKPALSFVNDERSGHFISYFTNVNAGANTFTFSVPWQKWNYFVYTYVNGTCEFYINGQLTHIAQLKNDQPTYQIQDTMTVGQENGLYGSVCNVNYFENPLPLAEIITIYNVLSVQNPPVFITESTTPSKSWYDYFHLHLLLKRNNT
jgi:hypothetical protein